MSHVKGWYTEFYIYSAQTQNIRRLANHIFDAALGTSFYQIVARSKAALTISTALDNK